MAKWLSPDLTTLSKPSIMLISTLSKASMMLVLVGFTLTQPNFAISILLISHPVLIMINLIISHSHSNNKRYGKRNIQICIMPIA